MIILTSDIMTVEVYNLIMNYISSKLEEAGYSVEKQKSTKPTNMLRSGLDVSKRSPASLFYLPSQAKVAEDSFFDYYDNNGRQEYLDATQRVEHAAISIDPEPLPWTPDANQSEDVNQLSVKAAIDKWRLTPEGNGHAAFFQLAVELRGAGMGASEIQSTLSEEAQQGRSPAERKAQIPSIMSTLKGSQVQMHH